MNRRPKLSSTHVNDFYDILEERTTSDKQLEFYKDVFLYYTIYPDISPEELHEKIKAPTGYCRQALLDILNIIDILEENTSKREFSTLTIIPTRELKPFLYIDQTGKRWQCVNEFFGI